MPKNKQIALIYFLLAAVALAAFIQVCRCEFINYDDPFYVTENTHIQSGFSTGAIRWAFTTFYAANWHPLTWMSHMLDVELYRIQARHASPDESTVPPCKHAAAVFCSPPYDQSCAGKALSSPLLFAVHPLHVQSVAWVAERKDVLCTFFWMLAMGAYVRYIERPRPGSYVSVLAFFALGLMAKPMVVTLPFVLLLLDYWPLRRFEENDSARDMRSGANAHVLTNKGKRKSGKKLSAQAAVKEIRPADHRSRQASIRLALLGKSALSCFGGDFKCGDIHSPGKR